MFLIVGLGNPEEKYFKTFHNVGFMVLDKISEKLGKPIKKDMCKGKTLQTVICGNEVIFAKPQTYMNLSGECVKSIASKYSIPPENILIIYDDLDLELGILRFRRQGSAGTHNGMRNIVSCLSTTNFNRLRVGIGKPDGNIINYVLSNIKPNDAVHMEKAFEKACDVAISFAEGKNIDIVMQQCNTND